MPPLFSVILPTFNRARMLRTALTTVRRQVFEDWECWVVDDGSTDDTKQVLSEFLEDRRIHVIASERNRGMNASRNEALKKAQGRFVTFLDSDDLWLPRRLLEFQARARESKESGFIFSNAYLWRFDRIIGTMFDQRRVIPEGVLPGHYAVGDKYLPYVTTNVAITRDAFERWGAFRTDMGTLDTELFARFLAAGLPVAAIREPLSIRRLHGEQLTGRYVENFKESVMALESSGAPAEVLKARREDFARETAGYLIKSGHPEEAREFLLKNLGVQSPLSFLSLISRVPAGILNLGKSVRRAYLVARRSPGLASREFQEAYRFAQPLLAEEQGIR